jgi:hypothetical protein
MNDYYFVCTPETLEGLYKYEDEVPFELFLNYLYYKNMIEFPDRYLLQSDKINEIMSKTLHRDYDIDNVNEEMTKLVCEIFSLNVDYAYGRIMFNIPTHDEYIFVNNEDNSFKFEKTDDYDKKVSLKNIRKHIETYYTFNVDGENNIYFEYHLKNKIPNFAFVYEGTGIS